jgi:hypothetical protein
MTETSKRKYLDHNDWVVTADSLVRTFGTLREAASFMRSSLVSGKLLVMLSMKPRK